MPNWGEIKRRTPSAKTRHTTCAPFACVGELHVTLAPMEITYRCTGCGATVERFAVLTFVPEQWADEGPHGL